MSAGQRVFFSLAFVRSGCSVPKIPHLNSLELICLDWLTEVAFLSSSSIRDSVQSPKTSARVFCKQQKSFHYREMDRVRSRQARNSPKQAWQSASPVIESDDPYFQALTRKEWLCRSRYWTDMSIGNCRRLLPANPSVRRRHLDTEQSLFA